MCVDLGQLHRKTFDNRQAISGLQSVWIADEGGHRVACDR